MNEPTSHLPKKKGFILYQDNFPMIMQLNATQRGHLLAAIFEYHGTGKVSRPMTGALAVAFECIRATLDRDGEAYEERCQKMKENGKLGGRPRKNLSENSVQNDEASAEKNQKVFKKPDIDIDIDRDRDIDREEELSPKSPPPPLSEDEQKELEKNGIPPSYAEERLARARVFAKSQKKQVLEVLSDWWNTDQHKTPPNQKPSDFNSFKSSTPYKLSKPSPPKEKSYDVDDFIAAALRRSEEEAKILIELDRQKHK